MGKEKKLKKKCCGKFRKKGKHCGRCPVTARLSDLENAGKKRKSKEKGKKKKKLSKKKKLKKAEKENKKSSSLAA